MWLCSEDDLLLFSDSERWALLRSWKGEKNTYPLKCLDFVFKKKNEMEEREREKESAHTESLSLFTFSSCVYWIDPYFMSAHQADSNSSRETQGKRDFDSSPPPKSLPVIVCSWVSKVNMVREVWGCWSCVFQSQGQPPSHQQIHASILRIMPLFTHKFCSSLEKHLAQIRQFTMEVGVGGWVGGMSDR